MINDWYKGYIEGYLKGLILSFGLMLIIAATGWIQIQNELIAHKLLMPLLIATIGWTIVYGSFVFVPLALVMAFFSVEVVSYLLPATWVTLPNAIGFNIVLGAVLFLAGYIFHPGNKPSIEITFK